MFAKAVSIASEYTIPVIISHRFFDGTIECGCASFIVLNDEGWIMTSAHVLNSGMAAEQHIKEIQEYSRRKSDIEKNKQLNHKQKNKIIRSLPCNNKWIQTHAFWWGADIRSIKEFIFNQSVDLAIGKLDPFDSKSITTYPTFKNPKDELLPGTSLCRLGFPFHSIGATFDEGKSQFILEPGALPIPRFPIEGIHTRILVVQDEKGNKIGKFIETSSPGLRGQSGGPIFDSNGDIWGLQSHTNTLQLGFSPKVKKGNKEIEEHQFMNVGVGTHVEEIIKFLNDNKVKVLTS